MRSFVVLALLGLALLAVAFVVRTGLLSRKDPGRPINAAMRSALEAPQVSTADALAIAQKFPTAKRTASGLLYVVHKPGDGEKPFKGQIVTVNYLGTFLNGEKFDASADHGAPFNFQVGFGRVIPGWDEACADMRRGESRTVIVPWWLAYGEKGRGKIPPRATLVFDLEILDIR
ncbi:FKBP-type peptidyl-prolyl cis-trans isomerase [Nibricoccus sp. IMCC34717]|uniref:FKBP-type peptidyl-prolyl cis-trans isomerase n=1 Tax=Nibricoccus sp. IMCC34717 TaxID=3034021 RepID=UPI00384C1209